MKFYILENMKIKPVGVLDWAKWYEKNKQTIETTTIGDIQITTEFVGIDDSVFEIDSPLLFETVILGGDMNGWVCQYSTLAEAKSGHFDAVDDVKRRIERK